MNNEVISILKNHKSIRSFEKKKIEKEVLDELLTAGIRAANGGNLQGYSLVVLDDLDKLEELGIYNTPLVIIALADVYRTKRWFSAFCEDKAPVNTTHSFFINNWDALICLHSISIAAESLGIGTYYNGDVTSMDVRKVINNPEYTFPSGMLCLGYPKNEGRLSDRLPLEAVVHYNTYKIPTDEEIKEWYYEKENLFQTRNTKKRLEEIKRNIKESGYDL